MENQRRSLGIGRQKFEYDLERAEPFETRIMNWFEDNYCPVEDVRQIPYFHKADVDFKILGNPVAWAEIKVDFFDNRNYVFEAISSKTYDTEGWLTKTKARVLFYYFVKDLELDILWNFQELKDWLFRSNFPLIEMGDDGLCILVRRDLLDAIFQPEKHQVGGDRDA